jgi:single-strand DNA-binding protein
MASLNICHLIGNLTRDPELRVTPKGTPICQFGLAVSRTFKDEAGQNREEVAFIDVEAWGKTGENIAKYCTKGKSLYVQGRLKFDQWDDKTSGQKRSKIKVVCDQFQFIGGKADAGEGVQSDAPADPDQTQRPAAPPPRSNRPQPAADGHNVRVDETDEDQVPF